MVYVVLITASSYDSQVVLMSVLHVLCCRIFTQTLFCIVPNQLAHFMRKLEIVYCDIKQFVRNLFHQYFELRTPINLKYTKFFLSFSIAYSNGSGIGFGSLFSTAPELYLHGLW